MPHTVTRRRKSKRWHRPTRGRCYDSAPRAAMGHGISELGILEHDFAQKVAQGAPLDLGQRLERLVHPADNLRQYRAKSPLAARGRLHVNPVLAAPPLRGASPAPS